MRMWRSVSLRTPSALTALAIREQAAAHDAELAVHSFAPALRRRADDLRLAVPNWPTSLRPGHSRRSGRGADRTDRRARVVIYSPAVPQRHVEPVTGTAEATAPPTCGARRSRPTRSSRRTGTALVSGVRSRSRGATPCTRHGHTQPPTGSSSSPPPGMTLERAAVSSTPSAGAPRRRAAPSNDHVSACRRRRPGRPPGRRRSGSKIVDAVLTFNRGVFTNPVRRGLVSVAFDLDAVQRSGGAHRTSPARSRRISSTPLSARHRLSA